jgi:predicted nucleotide-binding protein (sugar kinase/HSP70/actin superfamily)
MGIPEELKTVWKINEIQNIHSEQKRKQKEVQKAYKDARKLKGIIRKELEKGKNLEETLILVLHNPIVLKTYNSLQDEFINRNVRNILRQEFYKEQKAKNTEGTER